MPIDPGTLAFTAGTSAASTFALDAAEDKIVGATKAINGVDIRDKFAMHQLHLERAMQQQMARNPIKNPKTAGNNPGFAHTASQVAIKHTGMNSIQQFNLKKERAQLHRNKASALARFKG